MIVVYQGASDAQAQFGGCDDPRDYLTIGEPYEVDAVDVHSWHTRLTLTEFADKRFNSVCFSELYTTKIPGAAHDVT